MVIHKKFLNANLFLIKTFLITKFDCIMNVNKILDSMFTLPYLPTVRATSLSPLEYLQYKRPEYKEKFPLNKRAMDKTMGLFWYFTSAWFGKKIPKYDMCGFCREFDMLQCIFRYVAHVCAILELYLCNWYFWKKHVFVYLCFWHQIF